MKWVELCNINISVGCLVSYFTSREEENALIIVCLVKINWWYVVEILKFFFFFFLVIAALFKVEVLTLPPYSRSFLKDCYFFFPLFLLPSGIQFSLLMFYCLLSVPLLPLKVFECVTLYLVVCAKCIEQCICVGS